MAACAARRSSASESELSGAGRQLRSPTSLRPSSSRPARAIVQPLRQYGLYAAALDPASGDDSVAESSDASGVTLCGQATTKPDR
jgi:hypothetical protein